MHIKQTYLAWTAALSASVLAPLSVFAIDLQPGLKGSTENLTASTPGDINKTNLVSLIGNIVSALLGTLGIIFLLIVVYAGYLYLTAMGEKDNITKAKTLLKNGIFGIVLVVAAYAISSFTVTVLTKVTGG